MVIFLRAYKIRPVSDPFDVKDARNHSNTFHGDLTAALYNPNTSFVSRYIYIHFLFWALSSVELLMTRVTLAVFVAVAFIAQPVGTLF